MHFISLLRFSFEVLIIMFSPGQKRGTCGHVMAIFDGHLKCARCRDKGVGEDDCVLKKDCPICKAFIPEQVQQLATPTYRERKNKDKKMVSASPTPTLVDPLHVSVLGKVGGEKAVVQPETTPAGKKKRSNSPKPSPRSSKKKPSTSSKPSSEDLKNLDDKWAERFARLGAMLLSKSFAVLVEPVVKPAEVITSQKPSFDRGASTSNLAETAEPFGPSLVQATGDAVVQPRGNESQQIATQPVEAPGAGTATQPVDSPGAGTATQPVDFPGAGTATQPVQAPGAGPDVLLSGTGDAALSVDQTLTGGRVVQSTSGSESEDDQHSEAGSLLEGNFRDGSPDRDLTRDESADQEFSEEASHRETIRGVRSFMDWHKVPEFESVSSSDDNPFAGSHVQPTGKVSVKLPVDDWLCKKMEKLNFTTTEGYPARNTETAGLLKDQFIKPPWSSRWYGMHTDKKDCDNTTVCSWSPELGKLNSAFSRVARRSLPTAPPSRALSQDMLRCWERAAREQTVMYNQAAGLSRCLTRVQDAMSSQLNTLHLDKTKGKSSERMKQAVDELDYLVTFNRSISQAMARTMQDLSEGVFISMANFTLARKDSYLEYLHAGVKQDTLTALRMAPVHLHLLFPGQLLTKADEEISRSEERCSSGQSHRRRGRFHP